MSYWTLKESLLGQKAKQCIKTEKEKVSEKVNAQRRHKSWWQKTNQPNDALWQLCQRKEKNLTVIPSCPHSLSHSSSPSSLILLCPFPFFPLIFACSFVIRLTGELYGHRRDLYMMVCCHFSWLFLHSISSWNMNGSGMEKGRERGDATSRRRWV